MMPDYEDEREDIDLDYEDEDPLDPLPSGLYDQDEDDE